MAIFATNKQETNKKEKHRCPFKEKKKEKQLIGGRSACRQKLPGASS